VRLTNAWLLVSLGVLVPVAASARAPQKPPMASADQQSQEPKPEEGPFTIKETVEVTRVSRSCDRRERSGTVPHLDAIRGVLPPVAHASLAGQRLTTAAADLATQVGPVVAIPQVGGLHHRYERRAA
jgi:hypothetical protein